jgi:hypothetical protein
VGSNFLELTEAHNSASGSVSATRCLSKKEILGRISHVAKGDVTILPWFAAKIEDLSFTQKGSRPLRVKLLAAPFQDGDRVIVAGFPGLLSSHTQTPGWRPRLFSGSHVLGVFTVAIEWSAMVLP